MNKKAIPKIAEAVFDIIYLLTAFILGVILIATGNTLVKILWGIMAVVLAVGDSFHLAPRIVIAVKIGRRIKGNSSAASEILSNSNGLGKNKNTMVRNGLCKSENISVDNLLAKNENIAASNGLTLEKLLGIGKMLTSVTMTVFYLFLWHCGLILFNLDLTALTIVVYILASCRILLCFLPQNGWTKENPSYIFGIVRNVPFLLEGLAVMILFIVNIGILPKIDFVWLAILLSFVFYSPVVLFSHRNKKLGMLMLPKSLAYILIIAMGFML